MFLPELLPTIYSKPASVPTILGLSPIRNMFMREYADLVLLSMPVLLPTCASSTLFTGNIFPSSVTRYTSSAAACGTNSNGSDMPPSPPSGSIGGANCQGLANMSTRNTDRVNRSMPTKPDLLLRRSFLQGVAGCRGIGSSGKRWGAAGRLEQVQKGFNGAPMPLESVGVWPSSATGSFWGLDMAWMPLESAVV